MVVVVVSVNGESGYAWSRFGHYCGGWDFRIVKL